MVLKLILDEGAYEPERAHEADAGFDLRTPVEAYLPAKGAVTIDTGVHVQIPQGYVGMLKSKSGLNVKCGIRSEGVIDAGFCGSIVAKLYNDSEYPYGFARGDKITHLVIMPIADVEGFERVGEFQDTERGSRGFGSTGR